MQTRPLGTAVAASAARTLVLAAAAFSALALASCASSPRASADNDDAADAEPLLPTIVTDTDDTPSSPLQPAPPQTLTLLFAGDIMAHQNNYSYSDFGAIWEDVAPLVSSADLAFANVEAPVADSLAWSTYPQFNMHSSYVEAAIDAGFDVFSLANNHSNDKGLAGLHETRRWFTARAGIWACGIKETAGAPLTYQVVEKDGWRILFVAFTQVLNSWDSVAYLDYVQSTDEKQTAVLAALAALKAEHTPDLFVVSVHADEVEYKRTVWQKQRDFYRRLVHETGADIVWSNHAHVVKPWELVPPNDDTPHGALIMYANGNTISGQRTSPHWDAPDTERDWTGDGLMLTVTVEKRTDAGAGSGVAITGCEPHFITTILAANGQPVIRLLDDDLVHSMRRAGRAVWADYLAARKRLMESIAESPTL